VLKVKSIKVSHILSTFLFLLMDPVRPTYDMRHVSYDALTKLLPLFVRNLADKYKRALSLSNSSFFLSPYLCLPTHCRCTGYCCLCSYSDTPHSVGLLWTSDRPVAETSTWQNTILTRDRHPCPRWDSKTASELPQNHALDRTVTWIGLSNTKDRLTL
jgi:hypothetical protein